MVYVGAYLCFSLLFIGLALCNNIAGEIVLRGFLGLFGCVGTILVGGTFDDIYRPEDRAIPMASFSWIAILGMSATRFSTPSPSLPSPSLTFPYLLYSSQLLIRPTIRHLSTFFFSFPIGKKKGWALFLLSPSAGWYQLELTAEIFAKQALSRRPSTAASST